MTLKEISCIFHLFVCLGSDCLLKSVPNRKKLPTGYVSLFGRFGGLALRAQGFRFPGSEVLFFSFLWFFLSFLFSKEKKRKERTSPMVLRLHCPGNISGSDLDVLHTIQPSLSRPSRFVAPVSVLVFVLVWVLPLLRIL